MATDKERKPQETTREADTEREGERRDTHPNEALEGMPGYGQPPEEVRRKKLPEQKW
jgi:hypothetical protein